MKIINLNNMFNSLDDMFKEKLNLLSYSNLKPLYFYIISIGDDKASKVYIKKKKEFFNRFGVEVVVSEFNGDTDDQLMDIVNLIDNLNLHAIPYIIQLPLPDAYKKHEEFLISQISKKCDADGFLTSCYELDNCKNPFSATAKGVMYILRECVDSLEGKEVLIIGRTHLVAQPLAIKLMRFGATVTVAHTKTKSIHEKIKNSDIVISCAGANVIKKDDVKDGAMLIGVGFHYIDGKQHQDFYLDELNDTNCTVTDRINATGKATIYALFDNYLRLIMQ